MKLQVESQPIDREKANKMLADIEEMHKQQDGLKTMCRELQELLEERKTKTNDLDDEVGCF